MGDCPGLLAGADYLGLYVLHFPHTHARYDRIYSFFLSTFFACQIKFTRIIGYYTCMCVCAGVCVRTYIYVYIYVYVYSLHIYIYIHLNINLSTYTHICILCIHIIIWENGTVNYNGNVHY